MSEKLIGFDTSNTMDTRMIILMRLVLAFSALLIIYIDPSEPNRFVLATYLSLLFYVFYSAAIYFLFIRNGQFIHRIFPYSHWLDVVWYIVLISVSSGTSSVFFFFFFFAILQASFLWGFKTGFKVTIVSSVSFTVIGFLTSPGGPDFELNRFLLRPIYLTVLGYMMSYWGGYEINTKRRLALLKEISIVSNPRFGVDRTMIVVTELLRDFYKADECFLIMLNAETDEYVFHSSDRTNTESAIKSYSMNPQLIKNLFSLPENYAVVYGRKNYWIDSGNKTFYAIDLAEEKSSTQETEVFENIAEKLDAKSYLTVPIYHRTEVVGRIFIVAQEIGLFEQSDIDFLLQAINQFMPVVENIRLIDHLASDAAENERKKIARDIHDSIIQPYIGLQFGVDSILQLIGDENKYLEKDDSKKNKIIKDRIQRLKNLTERGVADLRSYIRGLSKPRGHESSLLPAIKRFSEKFTDTTGITVEIKSPDNIQIADRLAAELFQIVVEGLSNIKRHTHSRKALIKLTSDEDNIFLAIENDNDDNTVAKFTPRSISERVKLLGGFIEIKYKNNKTIVWLEIPL